VIRQLFNALSLRERALLVVFIWVILVIWFFALLDGAAARRNQLKLARLQLDQQNLLIDAADSIRARLASAREGLDTGRTFSASQLVGELDRIAREAGMVFDISSPSTQSNDLFSFHSVRLGIKRSRIEDLIAFDAEIKKHAPYITLAQFQITANRRDPRDLDATFELTSFELKEGALDNQ